MRTSFSYKVICLFMVVAFSVQSIGFSMDVHYCQGEFDNYSFFGKAEPCEMADSKLLEPLHECCKKRIKRLTALDGIKKKSDKCCSNEMIHLELDEDIDVESSSSLDKNQTQDLTFEILSKESKQIKSKKEVRLHNSDPPFSKQNTQVLYQIFRI